MGRETGRVGEANRRGLAMHAYLPPLVPHGCLRPEQSRLNQSRCPGYSYFPSRGSAWGPSTSR